MAPKQTKFSQCKFDSLLIEQLLTNFYALKCILQLLFITHSYCPLNCSYSPVVKLSGYFISVYSKIGIQDKTQEFVKKKKDGREKEEKKMNKFLVSKRIL